MLETILSLFHSKKFVLAMNGLVMTCGICNVPQHEGMIFGMIILACGSTAAIALSTDD